MNKSIIAIASIVFFHNMGYCQEVVQNIDSYEQVNDNELKINDPFEPMNRKVYSFNKGLDRFILKPASTFYDTVTPELLQMGITNFSNYLKTPFNALNYLLQGNKVQAGDAMGRFILNTIGLGVFDIASEANIPLENTSFGDTLGVWGVPSGPYVVLPILGGNTLRDSSSNLLIDINLSIPNQWPAQEKNLFTGLDILQTRVKYDGAISVLQDISLDEYSFVRDAQTQRRQNKIEELKE